MELHGFFKHKAGFDAVEALVGGQIRYAQKVVEVAASMVRNLGPGDLFLFCFCGHGVERGGRHLLLGPKSSLSDLTYYTETIVVDQLRDKTPRPGLARAFILDCCRRDVEQHRGDEGAGFRGSGAMRDVVARTPGHAGPLTVLCSCDEGTVAQEVADLQHGLFTYALLKELEAAGERGEKLALNDLLEASLRGRMQDLAVRHNLPRREQRPWIKRSGDAPVLLASLSSSASKAPPREVAAEAAPQPPVPGEAATFPLKDASPATPQPPPPPVPPTAAQRLAELQQRAADRRHEGAVKSSHLKQRFDSVYPGYQSLLDDPLVEPSELAEAWRLLGAELGLALPERPGKMEWKANGPVWAFHATPQRPFENSLGMKFLPVPASGEGAETVLFCLWPTRVQDYARYAEDFVAMSAQPPKEPVGFLAVIFGSGTWKSPGFEQGPDHPVVYVSWHDAQAFCMWLTGKERQEKRISGSQHYRLPADWEWSVAVGLDEPRTGTPRDKDGKIKGVYPWGKQWPPPAGAGNYGPSLGVDAYRHTSPVGSFAPNEQGLHDLGGNVYEWCTDFYDGQSGDRVLRGASWINDDADKLLSSCRLFGSAGERGLKGGLGFRCVLAG